MIQTVWVYVVVQAYAYAQGKIRMQYTIDTLAAFIFYGWSTFISTRVQQTDGWTLSTATSGKRNVAGVFLNRECVNFMYSPFIVKQASYPLLGSCENQQPKASPYQERRRTFDLRFCLWWKKRRPSSFFWMRVSTRRSSDPCSSRCP